jgi:hypothetical protein
MHTLALIFGITSGFAAVGHREPAANLMTTSLAIDASLAPLTAVIAARRTRSPLLWAILGFALGAWALAYVLIRQPRNDPEFPPTSDAA